MFFRQRIHREIPAVFRCMENATAVKIFSIFIIKFEDKLLLILKHKSTCL